MIDVGDVDTHGVTKLKVFEMRYLHNMLSITPSTTSALTTIKRHLTKQSYDEIKKLDVVEGEANEKNDQNETDFDNYSDSEFPVEERGVEYSIKSLHAKAARNLRPFQLIVCLLREITNVPVILFLFFTNS